MKKKVFFLLLIMISSIPSWAQLSEKDLTRLKETVTSRYNMSHMDGGSLYKTSSGYRVFVAIASVSAGEQQETAKTKCMRTASEFFAGATNKSISVYESSSKTGEETMSDKIVQSSMAQVKAMQPLGKIAENSNETVYAYYLVVSQTAAKNGIAGFLSIIPGVGQFYKGNNFKGTMFLSLTAAAAVGVIVSESTRSSYKNKAIEQPKYAKDYSTKADNWETARNVCIGVGAAIYLWNIIDAFTAKSARTKVVVNKDKYLSIQPFASQKDMGVALTLNF